jgi:hypothetical protein
VYIKLVDVKGKREAAIGPVHKGNENSLEWLHSVRRALQI